MLGRRKGERKRKGEGEGHKWKDLRNYLRLKGAALLNVPSLSSRRRCLARFSKLPSSFMPFRRSFLCPFLVLPLPRVILNR